MSEERISVRRSTRKRLQQRKEEVESEGRVTYSDQLREILPEDAEPLVHEEDPVVISVDKDAYERVDRLAGRGVALREVVEFFLYLDELDGSTSPREILDEVYRREEQE